MGTVKGWLIVVCSLFFVTVGLSPGFAQSDNTLFTEEQVYYNIVSDASFESWSGGTGTANTVPDAWTKVGTPTKYDKITNDKRLGATSAKITADADATMDGLSQVVTVEPSTTYTAGFYYKTTSGSLDFTITGTGAPSLTGNTNLSAADWTYIAFTFTSGSGASSLTLNFKSNAASAVFSLDAVMLTRGPLAPAYSNFAITDTGDQRIFGDLTIQDTDTTQSIALDKDTGNITMSGDLAVSGAGTSTFAGSITVTGTVTAGSLAGPTVTSGTSNDTFAIDTDYSGTNPALLFQTGAATTESITYDETGLEFEFSKQINVTGNITLSTANATVDGVNLDNVVLNTRQVATGAGLQGGGNLTADRTIAVRLNSNAGLVSNLGTDSNELGINLAANSGLTIGSNAIGVGVGTGLAASGGTLSLGSTYQDGSVYDTRFLNVAGDTMTGALNIGDGAADDLTLVKEGTATAGTTTYDSNDIILQGSYWDNAAAQNAQITLRNDVTDNNAYKLSVLKKAADEAESEVLSIDKSGNLEVAGTIEGRYVATDGATLDSIDTGAEMVTAINAAAVSLIDDDNIAATIARDSEVTTAVSNHAALTTGVHGVGVGAIVGTTLSQTLTNKDLSDSTNILKPDYYATTYVNVTGDTMTGPLTVGDQTTDTITLDTASVTVDDGAPNDSSILRFVGRYDSLAGAGITAASVNADIVHNVTSQAGASQLDINIGGSTVEASISSGGIDIASGASYKIGGTQISASNLSDGTSVAHIDAAETLSADWVNTQYPWADNEVSDTLTASKFVGTDSTSNAIDLATAEVSGVLPDANVANDLTISGGTINNSIIGATTAAAGTFTTLTANTDALLPTGSIETGEIEDGTILNADISSAAAIDWAKIDQTTVPDVVVGVQSTDISAPAVTAGVDSTFIFTTTSADQVSTGVTDDGVVLVTNEGTNYNYANVEVFNIEGEQIKAGGTGNQLWGRVTNFQANTPSAGTHTVTITVYNSTNRTAASPTAYDWTASDPTSLDIVFPFRYRLGTMSPLDLSKNTFTNATGEERDITSITDINNLQSFVGAVDGDTAPTYTSTNVVTQSASLETAVSALDSALGSGTLDSRYINQNTYDSSSLSIAGPATDDFLSLSLTETTTHSAYDTLQVARSGGSGAYAINVSSGNVYVAGNIVTPGTVDGIDISAHDTATTGVHGVGAGSIVGTTLEQTLSNKTLTSPTINNGSVSLASGTLVLPAATTPSQTAEGSAVWDSDSELLTIGTSAARKTMVDTDTAQTLSNKTLDATSVLPTDGYASTYVNVTGDTMTGTLTVGDAAADSIVLDTAPVTNNALNDSATLALIARYDLDAGAGTTAAQVNAEIVHNVTSEAGASQLDINIGGSTVEASISSGGIDIVSAAKYKIGGANLNFSDLAGTVGDTQIAAGAVDLDTSEVSGVLPDANVADVLTLTNIKTTSGTTSGHTVPAVADDTFALLSATQTLSAKTLSSPAISGGTINNATIGATTATTGKFTTLTATTSITALRTIYLIPEFENSLARPDGSSNRGTLKTKFADNHSYYEWTTNEPVAQDYDIVVRIKLPEGFSSFDTNPIKLYSKVSDNTGNTAVDVSMYDTANAAVTLTSASAIKNLTWIETSIGISGTPTLTANQWVTLVIKLTVDQNDSVDVGELSVKGNW